MKYWMIINRHGNPETFKGLRLPIYWARRDAINERDKAVPNARIVKVKVEAQ